MISETEFQRALFVALNAPSSAARLDRQQAGQIADRDETGRLRGYVHLAREGAGDLAGWIRGPGWHLEVEVKVRKPWTKAQRQRAACLARDGGIYVLVRWCPELDLAANVSRGAALVECAIGNRRLAGGGVIGGDPK